MLRFYSSFLNNMYYPFQICAYYNARQVRRNSKILIVDSGFGKRPVSVLELSSVQKKFADISVAPDIFKDVEKTVERTEKWNRLMSDQSRLIVIQGRTVEEYMECYSQLKSIDDFDYFGLGGLIGRNDTEIMKILELMIPKVKNENKKVHVFGVGCSNIELLKLLIRNKVDSFDSSSTVRYTIDGKIYTFSGESFDKVDIGRVPVNLIKEITCMNNIIINYKIQYLTDMIFTPKEQRKLTSFGNNDMEVKI